MPVPRQIPPYQPDPVDPVSLSIESLDTGIIADMSPATAPLESMASMDAMRFQSGGLRKDFGWAAIGAAAATRVLAFAEHQYISEGQVRHRLVRLSRTAGGLLLIELWDGAAWTTVIAPAHPIRDVYLSVVSIQNVLAIADGEFIYAWQEEAVLTNHEHNFAVDDFISTGQNSSDVTVVPAGAVNNHYIIRFSVYWTPAIGAEAVINLAARINGVVVERQSITHIFVDEVELFTKEYEFDLIHGIASGEALDLLIESSELPTQNRSISGWQFYEDIPETGVFAPVPDMWQLMKVSNFGAGSGIDYTFKFNIALGTSTTVTVGFWFSLGVLAEGSNLPALVMVQIDSQTYNSSGAKTHTITLAMPARSVFGLSIVSVDPVATTGDFTLMEEASINWTETPSFTLRPWNKTNDPDAGVEYNVDTGTNTQKLDVLALDAPNARFIAEFEDRLIALQNLGDPQAFAASADGDIKKWLGTDTEDLALVSSSSETGAIDDLQGLTPIGNAVGAVFRKHSIHRCFETGNVDLPVGVVKWIDHLGTESPFSIQLVLQGVMFLGHDLLVYFLNEQGALPVSTLIHDEFLDKVPVSSLGLVDSAYDQLLGVYFLGLPTVASPNQIAEVWMFELKRWLVDKVPRWRRRVMPVERMLAASRLV